MVSRCLFALFYQILAFIFSLNRVPISEFHQPSSLNLIVADIKFPEALTQRLCPLWTTKLRLAKFQDVKPNFKATFDGRRHQNLALIMFWAYLLFAKSSQLAVVWDHEGAFTFSAFLGGMFRPFLLGLRILETIRALGAVVVCLALLVRVWWYERVLPWTKSRSGFRLFREIALFISSQVSWNEAVREGNGAGFDYKIRSTFHKNHIWVFCEREVVDLLLFSHWGFMND